MNKIEVEAFIEEMENIGDVWTPEEVNDVYGDSTLEDALKDRKSQVETYLGAITTAMLNMD